MSKSKQRASTSLTLPVSHSDVANWGAWMGHTIPGEVCRHIAGAINERAVGDAARDVLLERLRQIDGEGWSAEHDDQHCWEMACAGAEYAFHAAAPEHLRLTPGPAWPWDLKWWKPSTPRRMLVKAAALILAEIDRIDRASNLRTSDQTGESK